MQAPIEPLSTGTQTNSTMTTHWNRPRHVRVVTLVLAIFLCMLSFWRDRPDLIIHDFTTAKWQDAGIARKESEESKSSSQSQLTNTATLNATTARTTAASPANANANTNTTTRNTLNRSKPSQSQLLNTKNTATKNDTTTITAASPTRKESEKSKSSQSQLPNMTNTTAKNATTARTAASPTNANTNVTTLGFPERWGPCDPRTIDLYRPDASRRVWYVSFGGWSQQRKTLIQQTAKDLSTDPQLQGMNIQSLLYTEQDLPGSYYQNFSWAFEQKHYRGFWTWKPWILRNLTETLFRPGDMVFWVDSDRTITEDKKNFKVAMCNMEHRNHNYGGVFPFHRCMRHPEWQYTKPETFVRMGLDPDVYGKGEQIYAGSMGFRINNETLDFLREWEDWGRVPVMYGNDVNFPSNPPPPKRYLSHKNDQAVFSLMVRSRGMKTWPAPYYWSGDSGMKQCFDRFQDAGYCFFFPSEGNVEKCQYLEQWIDKQPPPTPRSLPVASERWSK